MEEPRVTVYNLSDNQRVQSGRAYDAEEYKCGQGCSCLRTVSDGIVKVTSKFFYKLGYLIGTYPWVTIGLALLMVVACIPGIALYFYEETRGEKLWVPENSPAVTDKAWVDANFPTTIRFSDIVVEADNVLTPEIVQALLSMHLNITKIRDPKWNDVCVMNGPNCVTNSLLEFWSFDENVIRSLTEDEIINTVNTVTISPVYQTPLFIEKIVGGIIRDDITGRIISAKAASMSYILKANSTIPRISQFDAINFETKLVDIAKNGHPNILQESITQYSWATTSEEVGNSITGDISLLIGGYVLIFSFVALVLGKFNCIQQRVYVSLSGVLCVGLSIIISFGLCSYISMPYGPVHSILPFLLLGIGVDDMFVIVQALEKVTEDDPEKEKPINEKIALALEHAGVSVTVTSLTDVIAFAIGATTVLPALRSFCVYASFGILAVFLLQATFFVACITIDERRAYNLRNACCCSCMHPVDWRPNKCSQIPILQRIFDKVYAPTLVKLPIKIIVAIVTVVLFCVGVWGLSQLRQEADFNWFLPPDGDAFKYFSMKEKYFPGDGRTSTAVYTGDFDYYSAMSRMDKLHDAIVAEPYTDTSTVSNWWFSFREWLKTSTDISVTSLLDATGNPTSEEDLASLVHQFIFGPSKAGIRFASLVKFDDTKTRIVGGHVQLFHSQMSGSYDRVAGMDGLRGTCEVAGFPQGDCRAYGRLYITFEGYKVIQRELYRNIGLAFLAIMVMILLLLADLLSCLFVSLAVLLSLIDVGGMMYLWGLTIDTVTTIQLIIAVGLIVDYSAHVGHTFLKKKGTRNERVVSTMGYIGPAVLFGGFSTFLAFVLLAGSQSYVFKTFFKVLLSVVLFGLFHGLVFLPVVLSWIGPAPYLVCDYQKSPLDRGIDRLRRCTCTPSDRTREKLSRFREKSRDRMSKLGVKSRERWQNLRTRTGRPGILKRKAPPFSEDNIYYGTAGSNIFMTRNGQVVNPMDVPMSDADRRKQLGLHGSANPAFIPPKSRDSYTDDPVIYLPMSDLLSMNFRLTQGSGEPPKYATRTSAMSMPNMGREHKVHRIHRTQRVTQPTAWAPAYRLNAFNTHMGK